MKAVLFTSAAFLLASAVITPVFGQSAISDRPEKLSYPPLTY